MRLVQFSPSKHRIAGSGDQVTITSYDGDKLPPYALLAHTWGATEDDLASEDIENGAGKDKPGHAKVIFYDRRAKKDDLKHLWVDSCCITKSSDHERSESLNSMFRWYESAMRIFKMYLMATVIALEVPFVGQLLSEKDGGLLAGVRR